MSINAALLIVLLLIAVFFLFVEIFTVLFMLTGLPEEKSAVSGHFHSDQYRLHDRRKRSHHLVAPPSQTGHHHHAVWLYLCGGHCVHDYQRVAGLREIGGQ